MVVGPIHRQRAAIHQDNHQRLARPFQSSEQRFLLCRQVETGAIPTFESGHVDFHLFALKLRGDADHRHDYIGLTRRGSSFETRIGAHRQPYQLGSKSSSQILDFHRVAMSFRQSEGDFLRVGIVQDRIVHDQLSIQPHAVHRTNQTNLIAAGFSRSQKARPPRRKILHARRRSDCVRIGMEELEIKHRVDTHHLRCAGEIAAREIFALQPGLPIVGRKCGSWNHGFRAQEIGPGNVCHLGCCKLLANALQRRDRMRSRATVVAMQHLGRLGQRTYD